MNITRKKLLLSAFSILILSYSTFYIAPELCYLNQNTNGTVVCLDDIGELLFLFSISVLFILIPLSFVRDQIFNSWLRFSYWWLPITIIMFSIVPKYDGSLLPVTKEIVSLWMSGLFIFISLIIIIKKSLELRKTDTSKKIV